MTKLENYIGNGREYYWLAIDKAGKIAAFANANVAAIPDLIVNNPEIIEETFDPIFEWFDKNLPTRSKVKHGPDPRDNDFTNFGPQNGFWVEASQGLYTYDGYLRTQGRTYYMPFYPTLPLTVDTLPTQLQTELAPFRLGIDFAETPSFSEAETKAMFAPQ